ncbi:MAG: hypothetical protein JNL98_13630 [Bryobacterales bacterium]|nr:hypothetical protein [Bryobacterales bacterium]
MPQPSLFRRVTAALFGSRPLPHNKRKSTNRKQGRGWIVHGLRTRSPLNHDECPRKYASLRQSFLDQWEPATPREQELVAQLTNTYWRLRRLWCIETTLFGDRSLATYERFRETHSPFPDNVRAADAVRALPLLRRTSLDRIQQYERQFDIQFQRTVEALRVLRMARGEHAEPACPELPGQGHVLPAAEPTTSPVRAAILAFGGWLSGLLFWRRRPQPSPNPPGRLRTKTAR